tara:strand:+ start:359 stop:1078 length:720 start_codon:yes stop_codon:yes gene_type:complete
MSKTQIATGGIANDAVSEEHLDATAITGHTALAEAPADTDEFLISDGGTLKRLDASYIGGGLTLLNHTNQTSDVGDVNIDNVFSTTYDSYILIIRRAIMATDGQYLKMQVRSGGSSGSDYSTAYYDYVASGREVGSASTFDSTNDTEFHLANGGDNAESVGGTSAFLTIHTDHSDSSGAAMTFHGNVKTNDSGSTVRTFNIAGQLNVATSTLTATGLRFFSNSGNISKITFTLFGVNKS